MKLGAFAAAAAAMSGSVGSNLVQVEPAIAAESGETQKVRTICRACLNNCGMIAHVRDGKVVKLEGDPDDPMNKGAACAKGLAGIQALYNPNRIKYPMKRRGERGSNDWERISWEQAINEIADVMWEYYQKEGPKSLVCSTGGGGNPQFFSPARFLSVWGGGNFFEPGCAQCYLPRNHMEFCLNGTADTSLADGPVTEAYLPGILPDDKCTPTKTYVMWGVGPSYHGIGSTGRVVTDLRNNGMKTVVIDPRLTPDAARADVWLAIRPGTDVALMLAWMNYIIEHELWDQDFCREWTNLPFLVHEDSGLTCRASELDLGGEDEYVVWDKKANAAVAMPYPFDPSLDPEMFGTYTLPNGEQARTAFQVMKDHVAEWTLEKAAEICWLDAGEIEEAIKIYVEGCPNAGISLGVATDQARNSAQAAQGDAILDILMGCIRQPGSIVQDRPCYVEPCNYVVQPFGLHHPDHPLRTREEEANARLGYTEHKGLGHWLASHIPTVLKAIETGEPYRPRIWIERSGNKLAMIGNATRFYEAMMTTELNVHMYMHWTTTSVCLADYVLPTAEWLETAYAQDRLNTYAIRRPCAALRVRGRVHALVVAGRGAGRAGPPARHRLLQPRHRRKVLRHLLAHLRGVQGLRGLLRGQLLLRSRRLELGDVRRAGPASTRPSRSTPRSRTTATCSPTRRTRSCRPASTPRRSAASPTSTATSCWATRAPSTARAAWSRPPTCTPSPTTTIRCRTTWSRSSRRSPTPSTPTCSPRAASRSSITARCATRPTRARCTPIRKRGSTRKPRARSASRTATGCGWNRAAARRRAAPASRRAWRRRSSTRSASGTRSCWTRTTRTARGR